MSTITLEQAKQFLDVIHDEDDAKLQLLLNASEDEACQFMGRESLTILLDETTAELPASITMGVMILLQANYQATPEDAAKLRKAAEIKLTPYRIGWGI
ncbi:phage gp6-like head-tail connector protein [Shewanella baltica]|uniref:head-tail connector protein n=1 Tax=Shewanella baltica TaxID=62322 RepID=UPI00217DB9D1|nr:head-tail connector protein [Shewanella baltica]MCS6126684.1 phage gp6-like head-tail connector protein [Shewanella baltica]MCS6138757.1 phage gp6-like head-tail connector protein [Shewanella baltica]MCS6144946.1 phage gp6-like head-tail connector protein [Shewanella baltica]MCS6169476.1 phage gp6-like head-tail connector protein [Shewanella baltica]MCS6186700.1 phage gp6-like head-tail connector protein [Shewanella baltica]